MQRRDVLRLLGGAALPALLPLSPESRLQLARALHARLGTPARRTLSARQNALVSRVADMIIPATDTPGALAVRVPEFIDLLLSEWYDDAARSRFLGGLAALDARSRTEHNAAFADLAAADQAALLTALDGQHGAEGSAEEAFGTLKELVVYGYFTSETVMRDVLQTVILPGRFDGCVPY